MNFLQQSLPEPPPVVKANGAIHVPVQVSSGVTSAIETITPKIAEEYLRNRNALNRYVSKAATIKYARDMKEGRWSLTGQAIIFDKNGVLIDGHHRLTAAAEQGASFQSLVIRGVEPESVSRIDGGRTRTAAHMAHMNGVEDATAKCSIMFLILLHDRAGVKYLGTPEKSPTKAEVVDALRFATDIDVCVMKARETKKLMPKSAGGFCYHVFRRQNQAVADRFWEELRTGANLSSGNPVLHLRNRLIDNAAKKAKLRTEDIIALAFKAWVAYRDGKKIKNLGWRKDGHSPEAYPEI